MHYRSIEYDYVQCFINRILIVPGYIWDSFSVYIYGTLNKYTEVYFHEFGDIYFHDM